VSVSDDALLAAALEGSGRLGHREHVKLAWLALREDREGGADRVASVLRHVAAAHGEAGRYHETVTRFWIRLVEHTLDVAPGLDDFDGFLERFPLLLDGSLLGRHWSRDALAAGRPGWVEPDLLPLPR
jgi:hypothetical protein